MVLRENVRPFACMQVNQITRFNELAQPKLPREKFGISSDESKTESRKGTRQVPMCQSLIPNQ